MVWTGSTNFTPAGFLGQTNVGHLVDDPGTARKPDGVKFVEPVHTIVGWAPPRSRTMNLLWGIFVLVRGNSTCVPTNFLGRPAAAMAFSLASFSAPAALFVSWYTMRTSTPRSSAALSAPSTGGYVNS